MPGLDGTWREGLLEAFAPIRRPPTSRRRLAKAQAVFRAVGAAGMVATVIDAGERFSRAASVGVTSISKPRGTPIVQVIRVFAAPRLHRAELAVPASGPGRPVGSWGRPAAISCAQPAPVAAGAEFWRETLTHAPIVALRSGVADVARATGVSASDISPVSDTGVSACASPVAPVVKTADVVPPLSVSRPDFSLAADVRNSRPWEHVLAFDQPTALRRLLHAPGDQRFIGGQGLVRSLLELLKATGRSQISDKQGLAERAVLRSPAGGNVSSRIELVKEVARQARGQGITKGRWGDDVVLDQLRLRALAQLSSRTTRIDEVGWVGFLAWAGRCLTGLDLEGLPEPLLRGAAAALAAAQGYANALTRITGLAKIENRNEAHFDVRSRLALRAVIEGKASTRQVDELVPPSAATHGKRKESFWAPAFVAWHQLRERPASASFARLTAALVSSEFRERLRIASKKAHITPPGGWGSAPAVEAGAALIGLLAKADEIGRPASFVPSEWGGPSAHVWEEALQGTLGDRLATRLCFLDDRLSVAAGFLLFGMIPSCLATLRAARVDRVFRPAYTALERSAASSPDAMLSNKLLATFGSPPGHGFATLVRQVRKYADPSVELHSPFWLLGSEPAAAQSRFLKAGDLTRYCNNRDVVDHPQLPKRLRPFWLLRSRSDTRSVVDLALWVGQNTPEPPEARWLGFIERQARKVWPEWKTRI